MPPSSENGSIEALLAQLKPKFRRVLARYRIPPQDADDVVQEVLVQYWYKHGSIKTPGHWLMGSLKLQCLMYLRTRRRSRTVAVDEVILDLLADPERPAQERRVLRNEIRRHVESLDKWPCRELLTLRYFRGLDNREIAERMGYKPGSIDTTATRCRDRLIKKIAAAGLPGLQEGGNHDP